MSHPDVITSHRGIRDGVLCQIAIALVLLSFASCDWKDGDVVSKQKMEDILFDYHIAQAMVLNLTADERDNSLNYLDAVYEKHGITAAQFDSSLIYYNRHPDQLSDIYKNLKTRYERLDGQLSLMTGSNEMRTTYTAGGDTAEIWSGANLLILRDSPYLNRQTFTLKADTSFRPNDQFYLTADIDFIREDPSERNTHLYACLAVHYTNGRVVSYVRDTPNTSRVELRVNATDGQPIKSLYGYFYRTGQNRTRNLGIIRNISLLRYHTQPAGYTPVADTLSIDTLDTDTMLQASPKTTDTHRHIPALNPEEKRRMATDTIRDLRIKEMPAVRTPNSIGPSRRIRRR